jgi:hypothetical protein
VVLPLPRTAQEAAHTEFNALTHYLHRSKEPVEPPLLKPVPTGTAHPYPRYQHRSWEPVALPPPRPAKEAAHTNHNVLTHFLRRSKEPVELLPIKPLPASRNSSSQPQTTTQEVEASGASSPTDGQRRHKQRPQRAQHRHRGGDGDPWGVLASTWMTTSLAASRPTPPPHNGRPGSLRGGRRHSLGWGGEDKGRG